MRMDSDQVVAVCLLTRDEQLMARSTVARIDQGQLAFQVEVLEALDLTELTGLLHVSAQEV
jgi:hypothetical protein